MTKILFFIFHFAFLFSNKQNSPAEFTFKDQEFNVGSTLTRRNILFSNDCKTELKGTQSKTLDSLVKLLKTHPQLKIEIGAHDGKPCLKCDNCQPTVNAANAIKKHLVKNGIDEKRLTTIGYGLTTPLKQYSGTDQKEKTKAEKLNNRIVFKITYNTY
jgi:outer membrane protein OmpA-like peptidoglycan-associated protein